MKERLEKELEKIGLSEKEAKVYLAGLELGSSTAQTIAAKATVNRPTTYIMIESLIKRGLMSSFQKGKKRFFAASSPNQLLYVIGNKKRELLEQEKAVTSLVQDLVSLIKTKNLQTGVRVFEGAEGMHAVQEDILSSGVEEIFELLPADAAEKFSPPLFSGDNRNKFLKKFIIKLLFAGDGGSAETPDLKNKNLETRKIRNKDFPISAGVVIYGAKTALIPYQPKLVSILIDDENISATLRSLFFALWDQAE